MEEHNVLQVYRVVSSPEVMKWQVMKLWRPDDTRLIVNVAMKWILEWALMSDDKNCLTSHPPNTHYTDTCAPTASPCVFFPIVTQNIGQRLQKENKNSDSD